MAFCRPMPQKPQEFCGSPRDREGVGELGEKTGGVSRDETDLEGKMAAAGHFMGPKSVGSPHSVTPNNNNGPWSLRDF